MSINLNRQKMLPTDGREARRLLFHSSSFLYPKPNKCSFLLTLICRISLTGCFRDAGYYVSLDRELEIPGLSSSLFTRLILCGGLVDEWNASTWKLASLVKVEGSCLSLSRRSVGRSVLPPPPRRPLAVLALIPAPLPRTSTSSTHPAVWRQRAIDPFD